MLDGTNNYCKFLLSLTSLLIQHGFPIEIVRNVMHKYSLLKRFNLQQNGINCAFLLLFFKKL